MNAITNMFSSIKLDQFESDARIPIYVLGLGGSKLTSEDSNISSLAFFGFEPGFWLQSFALLAFQSVVNCIFAVIIYYGIVQNQQNGPESQNHGIPPLLLGYGFVIPLLIVLPCLLVDWFGLHNVAFILCVGGANPAMLLFRCLEAMHGTLPSYLTAQKQKQRKDGMDKDPAASLGQFVMYYASSIQFELDPVTGDPIKFDIRKHGPAKLYQFGTVFLQTTLCYSLLLSFDYQVFPSRRDSLVDMFYWGNLLNNYLMAAITSLCLESGTCGLGLMTSCLVGIKTMDLMDYPLTRSSSPSDFWGRRWNRLVGPCLRRGVYQPLRNSAHLQTHAASALTFVASGVLHEYVLYILSLRHGTTNFVPNYGNHFLFFAWCGITLLGERLLGPLIVGWVPPKGPLRTVLTLFTTLPLVHLFTDEYIAASFYSDISFGFPKILLLKEMNAYSK